MDTIPLTSIQANFATKAEAAAFAADFEAATEAWAGDFGPFPVGGGAFVVVGEADFLQGGVVLATSTIAAASKVIVSPPDTV